MMITRASLLSAVTVDAHAGIITTVGNTKVTTKRLKGGYLSLTIGKHRILAHHVIWLWVHGSLPQLNIDHIDGNPANNAISNLRLATVRQNSWNCGVRKDSKSGLKGAFKHKRGFISMIRVAGTRIYLGSFKTAQEAAAAYANAARIVQGRYCRV